jgi:hypothetical protein
MPPRVRGNSDWRNKIGSERGNLNYTYPRELNLKPGTELHNKIITAVLERAEDSYSVMSRRHDTWRKIDQNQTAYISTDTEEDIVKSKDERKPVSIVVPYSYATLETLLTYWVATFLNSPYFRYDGVTSEDTIGAIMLEKVIELQCMRNKVGLGLHTQFRDSLMYGFGVSAPIWTEYKGWKTYKDAAGIRQRDYQVLFEGNRLENIDPYLYLPDPSVPIHDVQKGEFVGWIERTNYMSLLDLERDSGGAIFNVRYLDGQDGISSIITTASDREKRVQGEAREGLLHSTVQPMDVVWMYLKLVPSDTSWKLGKDNYPEKWLFAVAADSIVIAAMPLNLDHNLYPVSICVPDYDGYSVTPISRMEIIHGLQGVLDFLFNSHVTNVRKAINDMIIVDPFLVNMGDMKDPKPGKLIRTRRAAWGRGVENVAKQLQVNDITRSNVADSNMVIDLMQRSSAAVDIVQGIMRQGGERRSATESRDARMGALSRIAKSTKIASIMTMQDLAYMFASHTQQLMTQELYLNTMGRYQQELIEEYAADPRMVIGPDNIPRGMKCNPNDLLINYDVVMHDGTMELGEFANEWVQLYQILAANPSIGGGFEMVRIFKHVARLMGAKNINEFVRKGGSVDIKTMQDELVQAEVQKGNMKALNQGGMSEGI